MKQPTLSLRLGTHADVSDIVYLSSGLFNASVYSSVSVLDTNFVRENYLSSLSLPINDACTILLRQNEQSKTIGFISCGHNKTVFTKDKYAIELGFWIIPEHKTFEGMKMLIEAYYYWAKETGCVAAMMGKLNKNKVESYRLKTWQ